MRIILTSLVFCLGTLPAFGQSVAEDCINDGLEAATRMTACTAVIVDASTPDKTEALLARAELFADSGNYAANVADLSAVLADNPEHIGALQDRAYGLYQLERFTEALADTSTLIRIDGDYYWNHYYHAEVLVQLDQPEAALAALTKSIALRDDYYYARYTRGRLLINAENYALAELDLRKAMELRPFAPYARLRMGDLYWKQGEQDIAANHYRMANLLDANIARARLRLQDLAPTEPPQMPPLDYRAPEPGMRIEYLQVLLPIEEQVDEMEAAIMELAGWFKASPKAVPEKLVFISRETTPRDGDIVDVALSVGAQKNLKLKLPPKVSYYRGFLPDILPGREKDPKIKAVFDTDLSELWPLKVGKSITGTGTYMLLCPEKPGMREIISGCRVGLDAVKMGEIKFSLAVTAQETIRVPLGLFPTYVVRFRELSFLQFPGKKRTRELETTWWISPELNFWLRRTGQRGDKIMVIEATAILAD
jgi:tetratricopeptide (TPR) repeat protein